MFFNFQGGHKLYIALTGHEDAQIMLNLATEIFENSKSDKRMAILDECLDIIFITSKVAAFLYAGTLFLYLLSPVYLYFFKDELVLMYALHLPFTNPKSKLGFGINFGNQFFYILYGLIGVTG